MLTRFVGVWGFVAKVQHPYLPPRNTTNRLRLHISINKLYFNIILLKSPRLYFIVKL